MATHFLPTPLTSEEACTLAALSMLTGKSKQQLLHEIVSRALKARERETLIEAILGKPRLKALIEADLEHSGRHDMRSL